VCFRFPRGRSPRTSLRAPIISMAYLLFCATFFALVFSPSRSWENRVVRDAGRERFSPGGQQGTRVIAFQWLAAPFPSYWNCHWCRVSTPPRPHPEEPATRASRSMIQSRPKARTSAAPEARGGWSYELFLALNVEVTVARRHERRKPGLSTFPKNNTRTPADLARNCRFFLARTGTRQGGFAALRWR
jgi:hypothetical protein